MSRRKALAIGALALAAVTLPLHAEKPDVRARLIAPPSMPAGTRTVLVVELTLGPGWHVNSHTPSETFLVPTELTPATSAGTLSPVRYPPQVERHFAFSEKPLHVYDGTVRFETDLEVPATAVDGVPITGTLSYQACNEQQCFPPARLALSAVIAIANPRSATPTR